ncbi:carbohydrate ABC transporter permease, partial [Paenarthrobacter sp. NPDC091711]
MTTMATPTQNQPTTPTTPAPVYNPKSESGTAKRIKSTIFHIIALALVAMVLYPALWMIASSFKPNSEIGGANTSLWSNNFSFDNFATAMEGIGGVSTLTFFTNSLILAVGAVVGTVLSASISAYAFARINFPGRGLFFGMMIATLL